MDKSEARNRQRRSLWLDRRRDHVVRQVLEEFFALVRSFHELYSVYLDCRNPDLGMVRHDLLSENTARSRRYIWSHLVKLIGQESAPGLLWQLKDRCHLVWPRHGHDQEEHGFLVDWLLGSVFHEAMKLKENIYLLNTYGPTALQLDGYGERQRQRQLSVRSQDSLPRLSRIIDVQELIRRIAHDVTSQMEQIGYLLCQATLAIRLMLRELAANPLVVRLLVEEEGFVTELWGERLEDLFADMFGSQGSRGFCVAGQSYLNAQWYGQALAAYKRAWQLDRRCDEARMKIATLKRMIDS